MQATFFFFNEEIDSFYAAGTFDYIADYANNGTICNDALNHTVGGDFSYNDSASNFTWATNDNLAVLGNADITTNNYIQNGAIDVAGVLTITTNNFTYNSPNDDFVLAENDSLTVIGDANITTNNFAISGSITTDSLNITAGYTAINQGSIASNSLDITAHDFFRNLTGGDISVDSLNITAGGKVTNTANINVAGTLNILANNNSTRENDTTGFYVSNRGNITAGSNISIYITIIIDIIKCTCFNSQVSCSNISTNITITNRSSSSHIKKSSCYNIQIICCLNHRISRI